jgi:CheY-like chemotaxis protein
MKILVIDDDLLLLRAIARILASDGHEVLTASDGSRGMMLFQQQRPELVITDIVMPEQEGIETILTLRREDDPVKIIAMSGRDVEMLETARLIGADDIIEKPFRAADLLARISAVTGRTGSAEAAASRLDAFLLSEHRQRQWVCARLAFHANDIAPITGYGGGFRRVAVGARGPRRRGAGPGGRRVEDRYRRRAARPADRRDPGGARPPGRAAHRTRPDQYRTRRDPRRADRHLS